MQGTWKENISGYRKDCKRKKQSRKHTLKDKAKWHISHSSNWRNKKESPSTTIEGAVEVTLNMVKPKKELYVGVYIIDVDNHNYNLKDYAWNLKPSGFFEGNNKTAFKYRDGYYDIYTNEFIRGIVKPLNKIDTIYLDWDENLPYVEERGWASVATDETIFLYGKPLPVDYWNIFGFYSTKSRKYAQNRANRIDRRNIKYWINNHDISKEVKTHALSKSIAWEIY